MKRKCPLPLPKGWKVLDEKYELRNDQGLTFEANLMTGSKNVVSLFKADKDMQIKTFEFMFADYDKTTPSLHLKKKFNLKAADTLYPIYIIEGGESAFAQCFIQGKDGELFCLIATLEEAGTTYADYKSKNSVFGDIESLIKVARQ